MDVEILRPRVYRSDDDPIVGPDLAWERRLWLWTENDPRVSYTPFGANDFVEFGDPVIVGGIDPDDETSFLVMTKPGDVFRMRVPPYVASVRVTKVRRELGGSGWEDVGPTQGPVIPRRELYGRIRISRQEIEDSRRKPSGAWWRQGQTAERAEFVRPPNRIDGPALPFFDRPVWVCDGCDHWGHYYAEPRGPKFCVRCDPGMALIVMTTDVFVERRRAQLERQFRVVTSRLYCLDG